MNRNLKSPATTLSVDEKQFNHLLTLISSVIPVAYIFRCVPDAPAIRLIIVLDQYRYQPGEETRNILDLITLGQVNIEIMCYTYATFNNIIRQGNLFFAKNCSPEHCVYHFTPRDEFFAPDPNLLSDWKTRQHRIIRNGMERATNFFNGASTFFDQGQFHLSAFLLHQTCEQMLRLIIKVYGGKELKTHQLPLLQKNAGFYFPLIKNIFEAKKSKELRWMELLQQAYVGARYDDDYEIKPESLCFLMDKISEMLDKLSEEFIGNLNDKDLAHQNKGFF